MAGAATSSTTRARPSARRRWSWRGRHTASSAPGSSRPWRRTSDGRARLDAIRPATRDREGRGYKVIPTLADQWGECGARVAPTYAFKTEAWYTGGYATPDPALASAIWRRWLTYRDWVAEVVARYEDDPTVAPGSSSTRPRSNPGGAFGACPPGDGPRDTLDRLYDGHVRPRQVDRPRPPVQPRHDRRRPVRDAGPAIPGRPRPPEHRPVRVPRLHAEPGDPGRPVEWPRRPHRSMRGTGQAALGRRDRDPTNRCRRDPRGSALRSGPRSGAVGASAWTASWPGTTPPPARRSTTTTSAHTTRRSSRTQPGRNTAAARRDATDDADDGACDASHCSLREAITAADNDPGLTSLSRSTSRDRPRTPSADDALPALTRPSSSTARPARLASGSRRSSSVAWTAPRDGLWLAHPSPSVRGLAINGFGWPASISSIAPRPATSGGPHWSRATGSGPTPPGRSRSRPSGRADAGIVIENGREQVGGVTGGDPNLIAGTTSASS